MSFSEALAPAVISALDLLAFDEEKLVEILNDCRTSTGDYDISRFPGLDLLPKSQLNELSDKIEAAAAKAGPLNAHDLSGRLAILASQDEQNREVRSPTQSEDPPDPIGDETFCYNELVAAGGRPVASVEHVLEAWKDPEANREVLRPWLGDKALEIREDDIPPIFTKQLEDWELFQHRWQWDNRGKYQGEEGFTTFFKSHKKHFLHMDSWKCLVSRHEGFAAYAQAVEKRLASHRFTQPFQLAEDPRQQDPWTTWVEYLNYNYWVQDSFVRRLKEAEPQYRQSWREFKRFALSPPSPSIPSKKPKTLDEELDAAKTELEATREQLRKFIKETWPYRQWETPIRHQKLRTQWVLDQLPLIERKAAKSSASASGGKKKKRKTRGEHDATPRQKPKRRRLEAGPTPDPGKASEMTMPDETAPTGSGLRRSQRIRAHVAAEKAPYSQPRSSGRETQKRRGRKGA